MLGRKFTVPATIGQTITRLRLLAVVLFVGLAGGGMLLLAHAATSSVSLDAENGSISGNACGISDSSASSAGAVKFGSGCSASASAPATPAATGAVICGNSSILGGGPTSAPAGAITVAAGDNSSVDFGQANKTYWFAPGTHTLGTGQYMSIVPGNNSTFVGAPGAIIDGQGKNLYAVQGNATGVTLKYLTFQNFGADRSTKTITTPSGTQLTLSVSSDLNNEGTVNHNAGHNWTISYNTIQYNAGAGVFIGTGDTVSYNCLYANAQYGFSAYEDAGVSNVVIDHNEISTNDTYDWESHIDGCGCTGGGKFWETKGAQFTNNYDHDNLSDGMWADTNNTGFNVSGNYFANNSGPAVEYEISYNILIKNNTFVKNAILAGKSNPGFATAAVYLSESGSDSRVAGAYGSNSDITGNVFTNNWGGVALWESADRFCSSPANTSSGSCTLGNTTLAAADAAGTADSTACHDFTGQLFNAPWIDDCRWKTQNVTVENNTFNMTPSAVDAQCTFANSCGLNALFSQFGTYPDGTPYNGWVVATHIVNSQNNVFKNNTYNGSWEFMAFNQSDVVTPAEWRAGFTDGNGSGVHVAGQDAGSTFN